MKEVMDHHYPMKIPKMKIGNRISELEISNYQGKNKQT
jgi:hypothetical protein